MAQDVKPAAAIAASAAPSMSKTGVEVMRLISIGKSKQAVELAKEQFKKDPSAESRDLLVGTYISRIEQFQAKGMVDEAVALLKLVAERFPDQKHRLGALSARSAATEGRVNDLVAPLGRPDLSPADRETIESSIRVHLTDLSALSSATTLPEGHELRVAAGAAWSAFQSVISGPVGDDAIALPEISRRSPLSAWKLLIRGIALFYRNDDEAARRTLAAIPEDSAVAKLSAVLVAAIDRKPLPAGSGEVLRQRLSGEGKDIKDAVTRIEAAVRHQDVSRLRRALADAIQCYSGSSPQHVDRLRQHLYVYCSMHGAPIEELKDVIGQVPHDSHFWKLNAHGVEAGGYPIAAATAWERYVAHGIAEGKFVADGPVVGVARLRAAELVASASPRVQRSLGRANDFVAQLRQRYEDQPAEIKALAPRMSEAHYNATALNPRWLFAEAGQINPDRKTFARWAEWAERRGMGDDGVEEALEAWSRALPNDVTPLILLADMAHDRKALKLALTRLAAAEAIDPLSPEVRRRRLRLALDTAWRHFKQSKPHLVEKDLRELEALPAARDGDAPLLLEAMRAAWHAQAGDVAAVEASRARLRESASPLLAEMLLQAVAVTIGKANKLAVAGAIDLRGQGPLDVGRMQARLVRLALDTDLKPGGTVGLDRQLSKVSRQIPSPFTLPDLASLATGSIWSKQLDQAYRFTAAGLASATGRWAAEFLRLRALTVESFMQRRIVQCIRAALELAQRAQDATLLRQIHSFIETVPLARRSLGGMPRLTDELLESILAAERKAVAPPKNRNIHSDEAVVMQIRDEWYWDDSRSYDDDYYDEDYDDEDDDEFYDEDDYEGEAGDPFDHLFPAGRGGKVGPMPPELKKRFDRAMAAVGRNAPLDEIDRFDPDLFVDMVAHQMGMSREMARQTIDLMKKTTGRGGGPNTGKNKRR